MSKEPSTTEIVSVLTVGAGCVMIGIVASSPLAGLAMWLCVAGMMGCLKEWIQGER